MAMAAYNQRATYRKSSRSQPGVPPIVVPEGGLLTEEDLTGQVDGVATSFTTGQAFRAGTLQVYRSGQKLILGTDYTEDSSTSFTTAETFASGEALEVLYVLA